MSRHLSEPWKCGGLGENGPYRLICLTTWSQINGCLGKIGRLELVGGDVSQGSDLRFKSSQHSQLIPAPPPPRLLFVDQNVALSPSYITTLCSLQPSETISPTKYFLAFALVTAFCYSKRKVRQPLIILTWFTLAVQNLFIVYE